MTVALVSGRGVADLQAVSGLSGPFRWVGSHGEEFDGPLPRRAGRAAGRAGRPPPPGGRRGPGRPARDQAGERRPCTSARSPTAPRPPTARAAATLADSSLTLKPGKDVLETALTDADKGSALRRLRAELRRRRGRCTSATTSPTRTASGRWAPTTSPSRSANGDTAARYRVAEIAGAARPCCAGWATCSAESGRVGVSRTEMTGRSESLSAAGCRHRSAQSLRTGILRRHSRPSGNARDAVVDKWSTRRD